MFSLVKIAIYTTSLAAFACRSRSGLSVSASPLPMPLALASPSHAFDTRSESVLPRSIEPRTRPGSPSTDPPHAFAESSSVSSPTLEKRAGSPYESIEAYSNDAKANSKRFKALAARSSSVDDDDYDYRQQCVTAMSDYQAHYTGLKGLLADLGSDKGLKNYDGTDPLQVLLKDIVNAHKDILFSTSVIVSNLPVVGPLLGPIVYELKCITEYVLDFIENVTDGILGPLKPVLQPLFNALSITTEKASGGDCPDHSLTLGEICLGLGSLGDGLLGGGGGGGGGGDLGGLGGVL